MQENWTFNTRKISLHNLDSIKNGINELKSDLNILKNVAFLILDEGANVIYNELSHLAYPFNSLGIIRLEEHSNNSIPLHELIQQLQAHGITLLIIGSVNAYYTEYLESIAKTSLINSGLIIHQELITAYPMDASLIKNIKEGHLHMKQLGHQAHLTSAESMHQANELNIESIRLGQIRQNIDRAEPWCRATDHALFFTDSLRATDYPVKHGTNTGGFFYEEACKITQFIGASSHLSSFCFLGYDPLQDQDHRSAAVFAQLIWYAIEGIYNFREDKSIVKSKLTRYTVHASHTDLDIHFWKNPESGRWWLEVPGEPDHWISCTYDDYLESSYGEFSPRLLRAINKV